MFWRNADAKLLRNLAAYRKTKNHSGVFNKLRNHYHKVQHIMWSTLTASDIHRDAVIAVSVRMPHLNGIVIHQEAIIEDDCLIMQQVTIGQTGDGAANIKRGVYIGAGAKVLGRIQVGKGARIGANAVVLKDVPANCTAVGVPAKTITPTD